MRVEAASSPGQQRAFQLGTERPWLWVASSESFSCSYSSGDAQR